MDHASQTFTYAIKGANGFCRQNNRSQNGADAGLEMEMDGGTSRCSVGSFIIHTYCISRGRIFVIHHRKEVHTSTRE
jgi:hypothetical protein